MSQHKVRSEDLPTHRILRVARDEFKKFKWITIENLGDDGFKYFAMGYIEDTGSAKIVRTNSRKNGRVFEGSGGINLEDVRSQFGKVYVLFGDNEEREYPDFDSFIEAIGIQE